MKKFFTIITMPFMILWSNIAGWTQLLVPKPTDIKHLPSTNQKQEILKPDLEVNVHKQVGIPQDPPTQDPLRLYDSNSSTLGISGTFTAVATVTNPGIHFVAEKQLEVKFRKEFNSENSNIIGFYTIEQASKDIKKGENL